MFEVSISKISDEEMMKRYKQIKPVITMNGKLHYFREYSLKELTNMSYLFNRSEDVKEEVEADELEVLEGRDFVCLHEYGYGGVFVPSIGEVLSQIKVHDIPRVKAFEIIESPKTKADFYKDSFTSIAYENGYHVSTVRLYGKKDDTSKIGVVYSYTDFACDFLIESIILSGSIKNDLEQMS